MDRYQVARAHVQVVLTGSDLVILPFGGKDDDEVVVGILVYLRPLVLVADVLDGQRVELEGLLQQLEVGVVGALDVEPESLGALAQAFGELRRTRLELRALGRDQVAANVAASTLTPQTLASD